MRTNASTNIVSYGDAARAYLLTEVFVNILERQRKSQGAQRAKHSSTVHKTTSGERQTHHDAPPDVNLRNHVGALAGKR